MEWSQLKHRLTSAHAARTAPFTLPPLIFELEPDFVLGARLANGSAAPIVRNIAVAGLEDRPIAPAAHRPNIVNAESLARGLRAVSNVLGNGASRVGLLVPDAAVRVAMLEFDALPESRHEAEALMCWKMKDSLPFPADQVRLSYQVVPQEKGIECMVVAGRSSIFAEYETALEKLSGDAALILPSTATLLPLLPRDETGLLIHLCSGSVTMVVIDRDRVRLWRARGLAGIEPQQLSTEVVSEAARVLAAARDRVQVEIGHVWLVARPPALPALETAVATLMGREVERIEPSPQFASTLGARERALYEAYGAPIAGLASNVTLERAQPAK